MLHVCEKWVIGLDIKLLSEKLKIESFWRQIKLEVSIKIGLFEYMEGIQVAKRD